MAKNWLVSIFAAIAMLASAGVLAQTVPSTYVGLDIGNADFGPVDDTAFKLYGGYQFHPNAAAEVGFAKLLDKGGVEVTALEVDFVGMFPVAPQLFVLGKLGFARLDASPGEDENDFTFGFGLQYDVNYNVGARLQWQRYTTDPDVDLLTIGLMFRF